MSDVSSSYKVVPDDVTGDLVEILRNSGLFKTPMELEVDKDHGCLRAAEYSFHTPYDFGVMFIHVGWGIPYGENGPTEADYYGIDPERFRGDYPRRKAYVLEVLDEHGWDEDALMCTLQSEFQDRDIDTEEVLEEWLRLKVLDDRIETFISGYLSEYTPGFSLTECLSSQECEEFGLKEVDIGGPCSGGVMAVKFSGDPKKLNARLEENEIPFRIKLNP